MKTGLHVNAWQAPEQVLDYYRRTHAPVVKLMQFDRAAMRELKALGVEIIGRVYWPNQGLDEGNWRAFMNSLLDHVRAFPEVDWWEGHNEAHAKDLAYYGRREIERMDALKALGKRAIIGNFAQGEPDLPDWPKFMPAIVHAKKHGHALGLHEYAGPYMAFGVQTPDGLNQFGPSGFTGASAEKIWDPTLSGWHTLRYRKVYDQLGAHGAGLPLFITESGIDDAPPWPHRTGPKGKGWRDYKGTGWESPQGFGDYADQRRWYSWQLSHDPHVRGVVEFGFQAEGSEWASFDLSRDQGMIDRLVETEKSLPRYGFTADRPQPGRREGSDAQILEDGRAYTAHVVKRGDTLFGLGGARWDEIRRTVPMGEPREFKVGTVVLIPDDIR